VMPSGASVIVKTLPPPGFRESLEKRNLIERLPYPDTLRKW
jgi:hypothetical protein